LGKNEKIQKNKGKANRLVEVRLQLAWIVNVGWNGGLGEKIPHEKKRGGSFQSQFNRKNSDQGLSWIVKRCFTEAKIR